MQINSEISSALQQIEAIKKAIDSSDDPKLQANTADSLKTILDILQDPVFRSIIQIQDSVSGLNNQIQQHPSFSPNDFDINVSGDLEINEYVRPVMDMYGGDYIDEQRVPSAQISPRSPNSPNISGKLEYSPQAAEAVARLDDERPHSSATNDTAHFSADILSSEWAQVQSLELVNDGTGLGFGIIGARTSGVIVKTIKPGGVAERDGRLLSGDHILQIGNVNLHDMVSEQVANVLRQSGTHVRLVVARPVDPMKVTQNMKNSAIVQASLLSDPIELEKHLIAAGYADILGASSIESTPTTNDNFEFIEPTKEELPETERFTVELRKDANGLGITIAGYVCEKEELSGIFVKSVSTGSAADLSGKIQVDDRIVEVDHQPLQGFSNHEAVEVLRRSGVVVTLCLERYHRGPKFEQLQQAIAANELRPQISSSSGTIFSGSRPHSVASSEKGSSELIRQPSLLSPIGSNSNNNIFVDSQSSKSVEIVPLPPSTERDAENMAANRKLVLARDSFETKAHLESGDAQIGDDTDETSPEMFYKPMYWVEPILTKEIENTIINKWQSVLGNDSKIIVAQIRKFAATSGLGISLEGTVDVEGGREVRPHHYIRSILPEGPVGQNGLLQSGDELLEVNGHRLLGMNHLEVVSILKDLPQDVRMVCARNEIELVPFTEENVRNNLESGQQNVSDIVPSADRLVKAKSDGSLATSGTSGDDSFSKLKSRSLEPLTGLAMWSSEPQIIELIKGERGLGFSILDYQDPLDQNDTLIVIRSLVPGGVAQLDGRLIPGDRLLFVNDINLENSSLDQAVQALKGAPKGVVRIGVAKPLPMADTSLTQNLTLDNSNALNDPNADTEIKMK